MRAGRLKGYVPGGSGEVADLDGLRIIDCFDVFAAFDGLFEQQRAEGGVLRGCIAGDFVGSVGVIFDGVNGDPLLIAGLDLGFVTGRHHDGEVIFGECGFLELAEAGFGGLVGLGGDSDFITTTAQGAFASGNGWTHAA